MNTFEILQKPYLESTLEGDNSLSIEGIPSLSRNNWENVLKAKDFTVIEIYSKKCPGCKRIDPLLPSLQSQLESGKA